MLGLYTPNGDIGSMPMRKNLMADANLLKKRVGEIQFPKYSNKISKHKKGQEPTVKVINTVFDIPPPNVNEENYEISFNTKLYSSNSNGSLDFEKIPKRDVYRLKNPLKDSFVKTEQSVTNPQSISVNNMKDPALQMIQKHKEGRKPLKFNKMYLNPETMEISTLSNVSEDSFNQSFNDALKKRLANEFFTPIKPIGGQSKKLKKPKIFKSDGQTVTAESVMRMVDPSFLVCSDVDDSSMISLNNNSIIGGGAAGLKLTNLLDDLNKVDPIDKALSMSNKTKASRAGAVRSGLNKGYTFDDFKCENLFENKENDKNIW
ncbi:hypothetical protein DASC09_040770 [Saccharomycopsis crataegensis]|uniref:Uncharacterized protein n=1 Tax=Saccharomycopsis crataegensis TaxID=43959 RepID=A0AAV5QQ58_9ASCO|nr:hypothetical protein DASC09_040770 [Saccharomycopsis crataegensis]